MCLVLTHVISVSPCTNLWGRGWVTVLLEVTIYYTGGGGAQYENKSTEIKSEVGELRIT